MKAGCAVHALFDVGSYIDYFVSGGEAYYQETSVGGLWRNVRYTITIGTDLSKAPEGATLDPSLTLAPECYVEEDGTTHWDVLGAGATQAYHAYVDKTAPTLSETTLSLFRGANATLTAEVSPFGVQPDGVNWSSSNEVVATVSPEGLVTGTGEGKAVITAASRKDPSAKATCEITVKVLPVTLYGTLQDENAMAQLYTWDLAYSDFFSTEDKLLLTGVYGIYILPLTKPENFSGINKSFEDSYALEKTGASRYLTIAAMGHDWVTPVWNTVEGEIYALLDDAGYIHIGVFCDEEEAGALSYTGWDWFESTLPELNLPGSDSDMYCSMVATEENGASVLSLTCFTGETNEIYRLTYTSDGVPARDNRESRDKIKVRILFGRIAAF